MTLLDISQQLFGGKPNAYTAASIAATDGDAAEVLYGTAYTDAESGEVEVLLDGTEMPTDPEDPDYELAGTLTCETFEGISEGDRVTVIRNGQNAKAIVLTPESTGVAAAAREAAAAAIAADEAAKVATDYLTFSEEDGLTVGASSLDRSVNVNAGGVDIVEKGEVAAHYGEYTLVGTKGVGGVRIVGAKLPDVDDWDGTEANPYFVICEDLQWYGNPEFGEVIAYSTRRHADYFVPNKGTDIVERALVIDRTGEYIKQPLVIDLEVSDGAADVPVVLPYDPSYGAGALFLIFQEGADWDTGSVLWLGMYGSYAGRVIADTNEFFYGASISVQGDLSAQSVSSPVASTSRLGVVKVGSGLSVARDGTLSASGGGDYDQLTNRPQIAGVTLTGDKSLADLGIQPVITPADTAWAYLAGSASATNYCRWRCKSGIVFVEVNYASGAAVPTASSGSKTFGTVPSGYRPTKGVTTLGYSGTNNICCYWIETDGKVKGNTRASSSQSAFYGFLSYPLD